MTLCQWLGALFVMSSSAFRLRNLAPDTQSPDYTLRDESIVSEYADRVSREAMCGMEDQIDGPSVSEVGKGGTEAASDARAAPEPSPPDSAERGRAVEMLRGSGDHCDIRTVIHPMASAIPQAKLGSCALVGSSADMTNKSLGEEIDKHDTVIRVNRIPTPEYSADFGNRTDILFTGAMAQGRPTFRPAGQSYQDFGGTLRACPWLGQDCPFRTVVLKAGDRYECGSSFEKRFPPWSPGWVPSPSDIVVAHQTDELNTLAYLLLRYDEYRNRPTNGFQAFLTFAYACERLDTYGFSGRGTADSHAVSPIHSMDREHHVMRRISEDRFPKTARRVSDHFKSCLRGKVRMLR